MPATLSNEAKLKEELKILKTSVSAFDQKSTVLSKELGQAQAALEKKKDVEKENTDLKHQLKVAEAKIAQLEAALDSAEAHAGSAAEVLAAAKAFKSILAKV